MNKKAFIPISALMGALLLALFAAMTPFVADPDIAYAQSADATLSNLAIVGEPGDVAANMTPGFAAATEDYTARIPFITGGVTVTATATDADNATVTFSHTDTDTSEDGQQINLASRAGMKTDIVVTVRAQAGNTKAYTISVYRERETRSDNANLSSLGISPGSLSPGFSASETSYKARVQAEKVTVTPRLSDTAGGASIGTLTATATGGTASVDDMEVTLGNEAETTTITVPVTAEDGTTTKNYMIEVYRIRANRAVDATLSALTLTSVGGAVVGSPLSLDTDHSDGTTTEYEERMDNATTAVTVLATPTDAGAVRVISPADADGNADGHQVSLTAGAITTITVRVTAEDTSSRMTYTIKVYRNRSTLSTEARLSSLSLSDGTLDPSFSRATTSYETRVGHDVDKVTVSYTTVDTAGAASVVVGATGTNAAVDGKEVTLADVGTETAITVAVTAEDASTTNTYTITVYRVRSLPSADATLSALTLAVVPASPSIVDDIALGTSDFSARVENGTTHVTVGTTATAADNGAEVDISPGDADTDTAGHQVALTAGMITTITVTVTAEDGTTTKAYMVEVYRERLDESEEATLSALSLSDGMLDPAFMSDRMEYDARVGSDVSEVTVSSTSTDDMGGVMTAVTATEGDGTTACVGGGTTTCDVDGMKVTLGGPGSETIISVAVTPEAGPGTDSANVETYMITVYRERRNLETVNTLSAFTIKDVNPSVTADANGEAEACGNETARVACNFLTQPDPDVGYRVRTVRVIATPSDNAGGAVAMITSPPDKDMTTAAHEIDLAAGAETMITVVVMAEDPSAPTRTYTAKVYRQGLTLDDDATLSSLMLSDAPLMYMDDNDMEMAGFMSDVMEYTADAPYSAMETTVTAMATHIGAQSSIMVGTLDNATPRVFTVGSDANSDMDGHQVTLTAGDNEIVVQVMSEDGTETEHYIVTVTRAAEASMDASLTSLSLTDNMGMAVALTAGVAAHWDTLDCPMMNDRAAMHATVDRADLMDNMSSPYCAMYAGLSDEAKMIVREVYADDPIMGFMPNIGMYYATVAGDVDMVTVDAMAMPGAMVSGDTGMQDLMVGENTITVSVTAEDEETMMTYTVMVTREALTDDQRLLERYDTNNNNMIDRAEAVQAVLDHQAGTLSRADAVRVVLLYQSGG